MHLHTVSCIRIRFYTSTNRNVLWRYRGNPSAHHITAGAESEPCWTLKCIVPSAWNKIEVGSFTEYAIIDRLIHHCDADWLEASLVNVVSFPSSRRGKVVLLYEPMKSIEACPHLCGRHCHVLWEAFGNPFHWSLLMRGY